MTLARRLLVPLAVAALVVAGCGSSKKTESNANTPAPAPKAACTPKSVSSKSGGAKAPAVANASDTAHKPKIAKPKGSPPASLVVKDLVVGCGPAIQAGQAASVQYVGISWSNDKQFDASWDRGQPFSFPLGQGQVIQGWDQGVAGMKAGGRRELVIPPQLGYGAQGSPPTIAPNETLVFVVDLTRIG
jgi:peptidylprolyl isomerase